MRTTNSSFRTREERECIKGLTTEQLIAVLVGVGVGKKEAEEYADDPNSVPTSIRKLIVAKKK